MTNSTFPVYSISISGLISLQLHALNNEGTEGNQSLTRRYYIVEKGNPEPKFVNGISGDTIKHIQAEHLHRICTESELPLSEGGKQCNPDRIGFDIELAEKQKTAFFTAQETDLAAKTAKVLQVCTVSDLEGFMVTEKGDKLSNASRLLNSALLSVCPVSSKPKVTFTPNTALKIQLLITCKLVRVCTRQF